MAILKQCEQCSKYVQGAYGMKCKKWEKKPFEDGKNCLYFEKLKKRKKKEEFRESFEDFSSLLPEDIIDYASEQKIEFKVSDEFLRQDLLNKGLPAKDVEVYVTQANSVLKEYNYMYGKKQIKYGIIAILVGPVMSFIGGVGLVSGHRWSPGMLGVGIGLIVWGIVELFRGVALKSRNKM